MTLFMLKTSGKGEGCVNKGSMNANPEVRENKSMGLSVNKSESLKA